MILYRRSVGVVDREREAWEKRDHYARLPSCTFPMCADNTVHKRIADLVLNDRIIRGRPMSISPLEKRKHRRP